MTTPETKVAEDLTHWFEILNKIGDVVMRLITIAILVYLFTLYCSTQHYNQAYAVETKAKASEKYWASNPKPLQSSECTCQEDGCCDCKDGCDCLPLPLHLDKDILRPNLSSLRKVKPIDDRLHEYRQGSADIPHRTDTKTKIILMLISEIEEQERRIDILESRLQSLEQRE